MKPISLAFTALLALAACDNGTQSAEIDAEEARAEGNVVGSGAISDPNTAGGPEAAQIPAAIQGRWGLVAADCEPGRDDAKGLLTVTADKLEFYESVGMLGAVEDASDTRIRAAFDFTGEGMTWQREMELDAQGGGRTLVRREYGPDAAPEPFRYAKCARRRDTCEPS